MVRSFACLPLLVVLGGAASGCALENQGSHGRGSGQRVVALPTCPDGSSVRQGFPIDTDAALETAAGQGAGVFIEYAKGGHWHVFTTCDTLRSGYGCEVDVTLQLSEGSVSDITAEGLESDDLVGSECADTLFLSVNTASDFDGAWFDAPPGALVRVTAALGGSAYPNIVHWVSAGIARHDAPNPFDLTPTAP